MSKNNDNEKSELTDKINELESLVDNNPELAKDNLIDESMIPILDELVTPEEFDKDYAKVQAEDALESNFDEIAKIVEQKLAHELDEIMNLLKGNLKDSILHDLQDQIKKDSGKDTDD